MQQDCKRDDVEETRLEEEGEKLQQSGDEFRFWAEDSDR